MIDRTRSLRMTLAVVAVVLFAVGFAGAPPVELTILHVNDLHARLLPDTEGRGGFAYVATVLERERRAAAAHLTLHAGDMVQGSPVSTLFEGAPIFTIANGLGIDVHCLGNHEFDYGWEKIREFVELSRFDTVSANVIDDTGNLIVPPFVVREVGGLRIAVVGATLEDLFGLVTSKKLGTWRAAPVVAALEPVVEAAAAVADMVIVLGHLGRGDAEAILEALPQVSVVVQGHPHRAWDRVLEVDGRIAVNASGYGRDVGRLRLSYDPQARRIVSYEWHVLPVVADELTADPGVAELVADWESRASETVDVPIGRATRAVRGAEMMALMKAALRDQTGAQLAYAEFGGIRDFLPAGELLARHVWNVVPFDNHVLTTEISGRRLIELRDMLLRRIPDDGLDSIDPEQVYRLATSDYYAEGWSDRGVDLDWTDTGVQVRDMIVAFIVERGSVPAQDRP